MPTENLCPIMARIAFRYRQTQQRILAAVVDISDAQLRWRPASEVHSIGFIVWHVARYADLLQATVPRMTAELAQRLETSEQLWEVEQLAQRWRWQEQELGQAGTGKGVGDDRAARLPLPPRSELLDYLQRTLAAAVRAVDAVNDRDFLMPIDPALDLGLITVGDSLLANLVHNNQHLGEIDCLRSLQRSAAVM